MECEQNSCEDDVQEKGSDPAKIRSYVEEEGMISDRRGDRERYGKAGWLNRAANLGALSPAQLKIGAAASFTEQRIPHARDSGRRLPIKVDLQPVAEHRRISYQEILEATNGFEENSLLGNGERALKSFHVECDIIRNVRHRNLIKIVTSCSSPDFKALIFEYMPNGSLEKWLYSHSCVLDITQRLDIMIDLACALDYLHHEYGLGGSVSTRCDVYSYGIVLMETFTRKKPIDEMFAGQMSLKCWVKESLPSAVIRVLDRNLLTRDGKNSFAEVDCLSSILKLALECATESPEQRINMKDVLSDQRPIFHFHPFNQFVANGFQLLVIILDV
ncbi:hypothetical protein RJ640_001094 [Escallonia rubra]|uniref:Protein kinase domain-containing protein n=1 Tax=Escallonia rubra TaxID=112253 RepID=A0AA88Q8Q4_9ASTE|nr:hypothetical protein RJ640_001094 [Escallonia rubra]